MTGRLGGAGDVGSDFAHGDDSPRDRERNEGSPILNHGDLGLGPNPFSPSKLNLQGNSPVSTNGTNGSPGTAGAGGAGGAGRKSLSSNKQDLSRKKILVSIEHTFRDAMAR